MSLSVQRQNHIATDRTSIEDKEFFRINPNSGVCSFEHFVLFIQL